MLAVGESVNVFFSHVRESSVISRSVIEIMMLMLWEGGWEWTTLTISNEIWSSSSSSSIPTPYIYILLLPPSGGMIGRYLLLSLLRPLKICIPFVAVLKKSKKRKAKTLLLQNRSTPIALAVRPAGFFLLWFSNFRSKTYHSVRGYPKKVEKTSSENTVPPLCQFSFLKLIVPLRAIPKKSKKRQPKTPLLTIRSTPIALAALPADFSSSSIFQFSAKNLSFR